MRRGAVVLAAGVLAAVFAGPAAGQETRPDTLARMVGRSVEDLTARLPGRPVSLEHVVSAALEWNFDLQVARARRRLVDASLRVEEGLFDPNLVAGWGLARSPTDLGRTGSWSAGLDQVLPWGTRLGLAVQGVRTPAAAGVPATHGADLGVTVSQPLLEGRGTLDTDVRVARAARRAAVADLLRTQEEVVAAVESAYWDLAEAEAVQAVLQRSLEIADALLFRNRQLADRALVPEMDVVTARSGVALRRAGFISARQAREDAAERLVHLAWGDAADPPRSGSDLPLKTADAPVLPAGPDPEDPAATEERALVARQDVASARADVEGAEALRRDADRAALPSVSLEGSVGSTSAGTSLGAAIGGLNEDRSWSLGLSFSQPLLNRRDRGRALSADLGVELTRLSLSIVERQVRFDVRVAARAVAAGLERLEAATEAASLAGVQLEAERRRLDLGLGDSFRLLETEENAVQAELEGVRARFDLARALTRYRLALGVVVPN